MIDSHRFRYARVCVRLVAMMDGHRRAHLRTARRALCPSGKRSLMIIYVPVAGGEPAAVNDGPIFINMQITAS